MEHYYYCSLLDFFQQVKNAKTVLSFQAVQKQHTVKGFGIVNIAEIEL